MRHLVKVLRGNPEDLRAGSDRGLHDALAMRRSGVGTPPVHQVLGCIQHLFL